MAFVDIEDIWDKLGFGRMQLLILFSCCMMQMYVSNEQLGLSVVLVAGANDLEMNNKRMGWLVACVFFGQFIFGHYFGHQSDHIGRLKVMLKTAILSMLSSFLSALMPDFYSFLVLRFLVGTFLTGVSVTLMTYLSEFTRISLRPTVSNFLNYPIAMSMILVPILALMLSYWDVHIKLWDNYQIASWRLLIILNLLPGIIGVCLLCRLPESAKFYLAVNQQADAMEVLERCCRVNKGKDTTLASLGVEGLAQLSSRPDEKEHNILLSLWYDTVPLFKGAYLRNMTLTLITSFVMFSVGFGLALWILRIQFISAAINEPLILCDILDEVQNSNISFSQTLCDINLENMTVSIVYGCVALTIFIITTLLFLCIKRRTIMLINALLSAFFGSLLNVLTTHMAIIAVFILFVVFPLCSLRMAISVIIDLVPTHLRAKGVALAFMVGRLGVMTSSLFVGYTLKVCCMITFNAFVVCLLIAALMIFLLPAEEYVKSLRESKS